ncbi:MAG: hypothetical protein HYT62_04830 [Candidatus Yanofskybacteria bacterium]|nr:hypothetical protein [Candidatus Yanofskybacteria bacterium]
MGIAKNIVYILCAFLLILGLISLAGEVFYKISYKINRKRRKKLTPEEKEALRSKRREEFLKIATQHCALRNTMDRGLKVSDFTMDQMIEMYKEDTKEETIQMAVKHLGMTREEAIEKGFVHGSTQVSFEVERRRESKKLGREIDHKDLLDIYRERLANSEYPGPDCLEPWEAKEYIKNNKWPGEDKTAHIESCTGCHIMVDMEKPVVYPPPGPDCYTQAELDQVVETGSLSDGRLDHKNYCQQCKNKLSSSQQDFIQKMVPNQPYHPIDFDMDFGD